MTNRSILFLIGSCLLATTTARAVSPGASGYNVKDYGAKGDGIALDSKAINNTIDAAAKAGGGTVLLPAGNYLSGSIHLKSNISLYLDQGAVIIATQSEANGEYDPAETTVNTAYQDYGHSHFHNSLIWGEDLHDVSILGPGTIWGKGLLRDSKDDSKLGNKAIVLLRCRNVIIRDISILSGGWFGILATGTDNLTIDNIKEDTNRDGMDIDCCKNVRVSNCFVNSPYDDGICLKSTYALGYARNTENVTITNCQVSGYDVGTLLNGTFKHSVSHPTGRIKLGTESNGGFKNITISNCVFDYCRGLALETVDGAELEDVAVTNITMRDVVSDPIFLRLGSRMRSPAGTPVGQLRRILISNVVIYNAEPHYVCTVSGIPGHDIEDVTLSNIKLYVKGGLTPNGTEANPPENEGMYPEPGMFGEAPAYGFFIRHAKNIKITAVEINMIKSDTRPVLIANDVQGLYLKELNAPGMTIDNKPIFNQISDLQVTDSLINK